jgi:hypothetical protein
VHVEDQARGWPVEIGNISRSGISFVIRRALQRNRIIDVDLRHDPRRFHCRLFARVVYAIKLPGNDFMIGCAFLETLTDEQLRELT